MSPAPTSGDGGYAVPTAIAAHPAWIRLESQQRYFSKRAAGYQNSYKIIKIVLIGLSAAIPLLAFLADSEKGKWVVAGAGFLIAVLEAVLLLNQFGSLWVRYRGTAESLKRERWLLLSRAGDYAGLGDDDALRRLAERVEAVLDSERSEWIEEQKQALSKLENTRRWVDEQRAQQGGATPDDGAAGNGADADADADGTEAGGLGRGGPGDVADGLGRGGPGDAAAGLGRGSPGDAAPADDVAPAQLRSMIQRAAALADRGDFAGARKLQEQALAALRGRLGADHPDTLLVMNNLGLTLQGQGDFAAARGLQQTVLAACRRVLGDQDPATLTAMSNLAMTLWHLGRVADAIPLLRGAAAGRKAVLGLAHPDTLEAEASLAQLVGEAPGGG